MASWDRAPDAKREQVVLRCLACGNRLDERLAVLGSLRCLDCRAKSAALDGRLIAAAEATEKQLPADL